RAAFSSAELSTTTRNLRGPDADEGTASSLVSSLASSLASSLMGPSRAAEGEAGAVTGGDRQHQAQQAVHKPEVVGEVVDVGADADLRDGERDDLGGGNGAVAEQIDLDQVCA